MAELNKKYQKVIEELESQITDPKELEFVKGKISELTILFMDSMDKIVAIENHQLKQDKKIRKLEKEIEHIEDDIYIEDGDNENEFEDDEDAYCNGCDQMHDNDYEFEIVCPYCNHEFVTDSSYKNEKEIECPKCHNSIELDWNETECTGSCDSCSSHCYHDNNESLKIAEDDINYDANNDQSNKNNESDIKSTNHKPKNVQPKQKEQRNDNQKNNEDDM